MTWLIERMIVVDLALLTAIFRVRVFCDEWFGWTTRRFELVLIAAYFVCAVVPVGTSYFLGSRELMWACSLFVAAGLWLEQSKSDNARVMKLLSKVWIGLRVSFVVLAVVLGLNELVAPPHHWLDLLAALEFCWYAAVHYATSMPRGTGRPGRKRREALAKLKEKMGGVAPLPVPTPA